MADVAAVLRATRQSNCNWIRDPCKLFCHAKFTENQVAARRRSISLVGDVLGAQLRLPNYRRYILVLPIDNRGWSEPRASDLCTGPFKVRGGSINKLSPCSLNGHGSPLLPWNWAVIELQLHSGYWARSARHTMGKKSSFWGNKFQNIFFTLPTLFVNSEMYNPQTWERNDLLCWIRQEKKVFFLNLFDITLKYRKKESIPISS